MSLLGVGRRVPHPSPGCQALPPPPLLLLLLLLLLPPLRTARRKGASVVQGVT